jgi:hypothetical protein
MSDEPKRVQATQPGHQCPFCREMIADFAQICPWCHSNLLPQAKDFEDPKVVIGFLLLTVVVVAPFVIPGIGFLISAGLFLYLVFFFDGGISNKP